VAHSTHNKPDPLTESGGKTRPAPTALGRVGIDEIESLAHQCLFKVQHHPREVEEALGVDEEADGAAAGGVVRRLDAFAEDERAVALAGLGVEADVVAEAGTAAALDADAQAPGVGRDALFGHRHADALERGFRDLDGLLRARLLALAGEQRHARERVFVRSGRRCAHRLRSGGRDGDGGH